ncbi:MAG: cation transporter [Actinomycetota bacterium]|nr:cation transporter [Actinomycetota bacterium]
MASSDLLVPDISCGHCKATIETQLAAATGVQDVVVDVTTKRVRVNFDENFTSTEKIRARLEEIGYPVA